MTRGVRTPHDVEAKFRQRYLLSGNVYGAAREVGLPVATGHELAKRAAEDPTFVDAQRALYARAMAEAERMMMSGMQRVHERLEQGAPDGVPVDPGPQYFRGMVSAYEAITKNRRLAAEMSGDIKPSEVVINVTPTVQAQERIDADGAEGD